MKISEITDLKLLDRLCAEARGWELLQSEDHEDYWNTKSVSNIPVREYRPTTNGQQAMDLLEKYRPILEKDEGCYIARMYRDRMWHVGIDEDPKIAIVKAVIVSVMGEEIDDDL